MRIGFRNNNVNYSRKGINKFQDGGAMPAPEEEMPMDEGAAPEEGAPAGGEAGGGDPMEMLMQLAQGAAQALQAQDPNMAFQVCEGLVQFVQMMQGGGGAPEEQGQPVYRRGGQLVRRIRK